jgi:hypothetical protein
MFSRASQKTGKFLSVQNSLLMSKRKIGAKSAGTGLSKNSTGLFNRKHSL